MNRAWAAIALEVIFFSLAFGWRSWLQWRRTGSTGFVRPSRDAGAAQMVGSIAMIVALLLFPAPPVADLAGLARFEILDTAWAAAAGVALCVAGIVLTFAAQLSMGESWRIGVDKSERTSLVTTGMFARVRNPIFTAMLVAAVGLVLLVPNVVAVVALVVLVASVEFQVRVVEEPYLHAVHGEAYDRYKRSTGRFFVRSGR